MMHEIGMFALGSLAGLLMGLLYDVMRALRKCVPHCGFWVGVEDFLFWFLTACVWLFLFGRFNKGLLRFYVFTGGAIGIGVYGLFLTKLIFPFFCLPFRLFAKIFHYVCIFFDKYKKFTRKILILPLKNIWRTIKMIYNNI